MPRKKQRASFGKKMKELRRQKDAEKRAAESPQAKKARLDQTAQIMREMRANETPEKTQNRLAQKRADFNLSTSSEKKTSNFKSSQKSSHKSQVLDLYMKAANDVDTVNDDESGSTGAESDTELTSTWPGAMNKRKKRRAERNFVSAFIGHQGKKSRKSLFNPNPDFENPVPTDAPDFDFIEDGEVPCQFCENPLDFGPQDQSVWCYDCEEITPVRSSVIASPRLGPLSDWTESAESESMLRVPCCECNCPVLYNDGDSVAWCDACCLTTSVDSLDNNAQLDVDTNFVHATVIPPDLTRDFQPAKETWCRETCVRVGLPKLPFKIITTPGKLGHPNEFTALPGDDFFHALSKAVSGSSHREMDTLFEYVCAHIADNPNLGVRFQNFHQDEEDFLFDRLISEHVVFYAAHLLRASIFIYNIEPQMWYEHSPTLLDLDSSSSNSFYLITNGGNRFAMVMSCSPSFQYTNMTGSLYEFVNAFNNRVPNMIAQCDPLISVNVEPLDLSNYNISNINDYDIPDQSALSRLRQYRAARITQSDSGGPQTPPNLETFSIGNLIKVCSFCSSLSFRREKYNCCFNGRVILPAPPPFPLELEALFTGQSEVAKRFQSNIVVYNNLFAFGATKMTLRTPPNANWNSTPAFRICGQIIHNVLPVLPANNRNYSASQFYFFDGDEAVRRRMESIPSNPTALDRQIISTLRDVLERVNPYASAHKHMYNVIREQRALARERGEPEPLVRMTLYSTHDERRGNLPLYNEVAAVFTGEGPPPREYTVYSNSNRVHVLDNRSPYIQPYIYPLLRPTGQFGYQPNTPHVGPNVTEQENTVTLRQYFQSELSIRETVPGHFNPLLRSGKLLQQYIVDAYCRVEENNLNWPRTNQNKLRVEQYRGLVDFLRGEENLPQPGATRPVLRPQPNRTPGTPFILPSSFEGSPRNQMARYQDSMTTVAAFGKPCALITFTCNPSWPEIADNIPEGQTFLDVPHLTSRVFKMKLDSFMNDIYVDGVLGRVASFVYVIEFQKRGLPHAHLIVHFASGDKILNPDDIDKIISAELPDPDTEPDLFRIVSNSMMHGPCGDRNPGCPCMKNGKCSKSYPKPYSDYTYLDNNNFPVYRRRQFVGRTGRNGLDNRWVVPYNPFLTLKYGTHINVEACTSLQAVKYLFKYVYKGHDLANINVTVSDKFNEISTFLECRYVGPSEAAWRLFSFPMHKQSHKVERLPLHLEGEQYVVFRPGQEAAAIDRAEAQDTKLTAFFKLCRSTPSTHGLFYLDVAKNFVWDTTSHSWKPRPRRNLNQLSRIIFCSPRAGERFYLRVLLLNVPGPRGFIDIRTVDNFICDTYQQACIRLGLVEDDFMWLNTIAESVRSHQLPSMVRRLFSAVLLFGEVASPLSLWNDYSYYMIDDFLRSGASNEQATARALGHISALLERGNSSLSSFNLPEVDIEAYVETIDVNSHAASADTTYELLTLEQRTVSDAIVDAVLNPNYTVPNLFFIDGPAGTGKTFVYRYLIERLRGNNLSISSTAWVGVAASLLQGGQTIHSFYNLPIELNEDSVCRFSPSKINILHSTSLFIMDEASMISSPGLQAIERSMRDVFSSNVLFGGRVIVLGGDFRQTLPIPPPQIAHRLLGYTILNCPFWSQFRRFRLTNNMRVLPGQERFAQFLMDVGNDTLPRSNKQPYPDCVELPSAICTDEDLINKIYPVNLTKEEYRNRIILCPTNKTALAINEQLMGRINGVQRTYLSADSAVTDGDPREGDIYTPEYLHSLTPSGMPAHQLSLKVGCIAMLLVNMDTVGGLVNGTRLEVVDMKDNYISGKILTGDRAGDIVLIPRVKFTPKNNKLPFRLSRCQFPLRLAYAMTIHKAQGQTFQTVGVHLDRPVFAHGQLYVALSRAISMENLFVRIINGQQQGKHRGKYYTRNVVIPFNDQV